MLLSIFVIYGAFVLLEILQQMLDVPHTRMLEREISRSLSNNKEEEKEVELKEKEDEDEKDSSTDVKTKRKTSRQRAKTKEALSGVSNAALQMQEETEMNEVDMTNFMD